MKILTENQVTRLVNNIVQACDNIEKLNKQGYDYLNLCSGFIAHYNLSGFIDYYSYHSLISDIESNAKANQWKNFNPADSHYDYMMQKRDIYNRILGKLVAKEYISNYYN